MPVCVLKVWPEVTVFPANLLDDPLPFPLHTERALTGRDDYGSSGHGGRKVAKRHAGQEVHHALVAPFEEPLGAPNKLIVRLGQRCCPKSAGWGEFSETVPLPAGKTIRHAPRAMKGEHWPWLEGQSFHDLVVKCVDLASGHVQDDDKVSAERALCAARAFSGRAAAQKAVVRNEVRVWGGPRHARVPPFPVGPCVFPAAMPCSCRCDLCRLLRLALRKTRGHPSS